MPMIFQEGVTYNVCTTTTEIPSGGTHKAPLIVLPEETGSWELVNSNAVCGITGKIHFFWFWRLLNDETKETD